SATTFCPHCQLTPGSTSLTAAATSFSARSVWPRRAARNSASLSGGRYCGGGRSAHSSSSKSQSSMASLTASARWLSVSSIQDRSDAGLGCHEDENGEFMTGSWGRGGMAAIVPHQEETSRKQFSAR